MDSDTFVLLPDQTYNSVGNDILEDESDSDDDSEEYLKEMETILRKIRRKRTRITGAVVYCYPRHILYEMGFHQSPNKKGGLLYFFTKSIKKTHMLSGVMFYM